jgi:hypothetical protein
MIEMTNLEAADILDPATRGTALLPYATDCDKRKELVDEACALAAKVLRNSEWISVKDRLPQTDELVLVIVSGKPNGNTTLEDAYQLADYDQNEGWILVNWPEWETPKVSYWMPLPEEPPEEARRE